MLHSFTRNYNDLSTDAGFQFEFFCDCCGNGFKSTFKQSSTYGKRQKSERFGQLASSMVKSGKCSNCGFNNEPGMKFCGECGAKL